MKPTATQKWAKNERAGGGGVIPCNWILHIAKGESFKKVTKVTNAIRSIGSSLDGYEDMEIRVRRKFTFDTCSCGRVQQNLAEYFNIF